MPIYAYKCESCGFARDVLRKLSDPPLTECPSCGAATFCKQLTAAGFQLKGSGWYATDFKGGAAPTAPTPPSPDAAAPAAATTTTTTTAKPSESSPPKANPPPASGAGGCGGSCSCH